MPWGTRLKVSTGRDATLYAVRGGASVNHDRVKKGIYETDDKHGEAVVRLYVT